MFWKSLRRSATHLHWMLFLPDLASWGFSIALFYLFLQVSGLAALFSSPEAASALLLANMPAMQEMVQAFLSQNAFRFGLSFTLFLFTTFVFGTSFIAMKYGLMRDLAFDRPPSLRRLYHYSMTYLEKVIVLRISLFLVSAGVLILTVLPLPVLESLLGRFVGVVTTVALVLAGQLLLRLVLFFRYPALFIAEKKAFAAMRMSVRFVTTRFRLALGTWCLVEAGYWALNGIQFYLILKAPLSSLVVLLWFLILTWNLWADLFLFFLFRSER